MTSHVGINVKFKSQHTLAKATRYIKTIKVLKRAQTGKNCDVVYTLMLT